MLLSIFEVTTVTANKPAAQLAEDFIGRPGLLDLPGMELSEELAKSYYIAEKGIEAAADTQPRHGSNDVSAPCVKQMILEGATAGSLQADPEALKFMHAEGIARLLPEKYTDDEKEMIAYVVYAEARGESFEGMAAVAQVITNRYESGKFGASIKDVVYSRHQFAVSKHYNEICMQAVEYAIDYTPYPKNMYYFQKSMRKNWYGMYFDRIGNHTFYCGKW